MHWRTVFKAWSSHTSPLRSSPFLDSCKYPDGEGQCWFLHIAPDYLVVGCEIAESSCVPWSSVFATETLRFTAGKRYSRRSLVGMDSAWLARPRPGLLLACTTTYLHSNSPYIIVQEVEHQVCLIHWVQEQLPETLLSISSASYVFKVSLGTIVTTN